jgi:hypothetical protein
MNRILKIKGAMLKYRRKLISLLLMLLSEQINFGGHVVIWRGSQKKE